MTKLNETALDRRTACALHIMSALVASGAAWGSSCCAETAMQAVAMADELIKALDGGTTWDDVDREIAKEKRERDEDLAELKARRDAALAGKPLPPGDA
jgi:hypothetical protein